VKEDHKVTRRQITTGSTLPTEQLSVFVQNNSTKPCHRKLRTVCLSNSYQDPRARCRARILHKDSSLSLGLI